MALRLVLLLGICVGLHLPSAARAQPSDVRPTWAGTSLRTFALVPPLRIPDALTAPVRLEPVAQALESAAAMSGAFSQTLGPAHIVASATPVPARESWRTQGLENDRGYWYTVGATGAASLGARTLLLLPAFFVLSLPALVPMSAAAAISVWFGGITVLSALDSAASAAAGVFMFESLNPGVSGSYWAALGGHFAGNVLAASAFWMTFGYGGMLLYGLEVLSPFALGAFSGLAALSSLLALPAVALTFVASLTIPAMMTAWAVSTTARGMRPDRLSSLSRRGPPILESSWRAEVASLPGWRIAFPGT